MVIFSIKSEKSRSSERVFPRAAVLLSVAYFVSTAFGFAAMMAYPHILGTSAKISSYRNYADSFSSLVSIAARNYLKIAKEAAGWAFLFILLSAAFMLVIRKYIEKSYTKARQRFILFVIKLIICIYPVFCLIYSLFVKTPITFPRYYFNFAFAVLLFAYIAALLIISIAALLSKEKSCRAPAVAFILGVISAVPLLVVSPIGARTLYISFVCFLISALTALDECFEKITVGKTASCALALGVCCACSVIFMAELDNKYCSSVRESYVRSQIENGCEKLTLPLLPHRNIVHDDSNRGAWTNYLSEISDKPPELEFVEWNEWYERYYRNQ